MKRKISTIIIAFIISVPIFLFSQNPPHPNGGSGPTGGNTPVGGGAPLEGGIITMLMLGAMYGTKKVYGLRQKVNE